MTVVLESERHERWAWQKRRGRERRKENGRGCVYRLLLLFLLRPYLHRGISPGRSEEEGFFSFSPPPSPFNSKKKRKTRKDPSSFARLNGRENFHPFFSFFSHPPPLFPHAFSARATRAEFDKKLASEIQNEDRKKKVQAFVICQVDLGLVGESRTKILLLC